MTTHAPTVAEVQDLITRALSGAPSIEGTRFEPADTLRGFWTGPGLYVCSTCSGRIMARGILLPEPAIPVYRDKPEPFGVCAGCETDRNPASP